MCSRSGKGLPRGWPWRGWLASNLLLLLLLLPLAIDMVGAEERRQALAQVSSSLASSTMVEGGSCNGGGGGEGGEAGCQGCRHLILLLVWDGALSRAMRVWMGLGVVAWRRPWPALVMGLGGVAVVALVVA